MSYVYLQHHGIKGQKWGVRRFQNADGSLTEKGRKRLGKNEAYRDRLANKANAKAKRFREESEQAKANIADLKKYGRNSVTYRHWKEDRDSERENEYERKNRIFDETGTAYVRKYSNSSDKLFNDLEDYLSADKKVKELISENDETVKRARKAAKRWIESNKNLMNMNISEFTSKKDIRKVYRSH